jgi:hypothetical protein
MIVGVFLQRAHPSPSCLCLHDKAAAALLLAKPQTMSELYGSRGSKWSAAESRSESHGGGDEA